jgi:hypothetical protein
MSIACTIHATYMQEAVGVEVRQPIKDLYHHSLGLVLVERAVGSRVPPSSS